MQHDPGRLVVQPPRFGDEDLAAIGPVQAYGPAPLGDPRLGRVSPRDVQRQLGGIRTKAPNEAARGPAPATAATAATPATPAPALGSLAALGFVGESATQTTAAGPAAQAATGESQTLYR